MKNTKTIKLILTWVGVKQFLTIPTFNNLLYPNQIKSLNVGVNIITVNHTILGKLKNLSDNIDIRYEEFTS